MDLPPALLRAQMSAVMLTPEEMTSIYGSQNPTTSQRRVSSSAGSTNTLARRHESSASAEEIGAQRPLSQKLSIKKLGGLFRTDKRARSSVAGSSEATIAESSIESEGGRDLNSFESSVGEESRPSLHVGGELQGRMRKQRRQPPQPLRIESLHENAGHVDNEARTDGRHHQRNESLHVNLAPEDLVRVAAEIYNETIADVSLSLFIYWIRESVENYEIAKRYVRELGLDAGYNTSRIANQHVRKLLQETAPSRPNEPLVALQEQHDSVERVASRSAVALPSSSFPVTARIDSLPARLRIQRERAVQEATRASSTGDRIAEYPPNTPDRPAPLTLRSPTFARPNTNLSSSSSSFPRSVSSGPNFVPLHLPRNSVILQDTASHPLLTGDATTRDDIFAIDWPAAPVYEQGPPTAIRLGFGPREDDTTLGPYALNESDAASSSSEASSDADNNSESILDPATGAGSSSAAAALPVVHPPVGTSTQQQSGRQPAAVVDWATLHPFERAWRELNAQLLVSICGTRAAVLREEDVRDVDEMSWRLREEGPASTGADWVRGIFLDPPGQ